MPSISAIGLSGLGAAQLQMQTSARTIAQAGLDPVADSGGGDDFVAATVQQIEAVYSYDANLRTVEVGNSVLGTLLNAFA
jgi:hypothetical protein